MTKFDRSQDFKLDNAPAYIVRGYDKLELGDIYGAMYDFDRAIELDPNNDLAYICRGQAKRDSGDINGAIDDYDRAEALNPNIAGLYTNRGSLRSKIDAVQSAVTENVIPINEADVDLDTSRSNLDNEGNIVDDINLSITIRSDNAQFYYGKYYHLGKAKIELGDIYGAIADFDRAIVLTPGIYKLYFQRGKAHLNLRDFRSAITDFDRAIQVNPNYALAYFYRSNAKLDLEDLQGALADFDSVLEIDPHIVNKYTIRDELLLRLDKQIVEQKIEKARLDRRSSLTLTFNTLEKLPESIGNLNQLSKLTLNCKQLEELPRNINQLSELTIGYQHLKSLPESIGNLRNLSKLVLNNNQLTSLPESIGNLTKLRELVLNNNQLTSLPESIGNLRNLSKLVLNNNQLTSLPESIGNLTNLRELVLNNNQLTILPESIENIGLNDLILNNNKLEKLPKSLTNIDYLDYWYCLDNLHVDLLTLLNISLFVRNELSYPDITMTVFFEGIELPERYWTNLSNWKAEWLLDEDNAEIRRILIGQLGYEKICQELNTIELDSWQEYTLFKIDGVDEYRIEEIFVDDPNPDKVHFDEKFVYDPVVLLKMTCPSTAHIHILRVPPEMESAEEAITWVNLGIHPDEFTVQT
jgi:leucine-rich repeat protein SHOC2